MAGATTLRLDVQHAAGAQVILRNRGRTVAILQDMAAQAADRRVDDDLPAFTVNEARDA
jgi:hypothetical protein